MNMIEINIMPFLPVSGCTGVEYNLLVDELQPLRMAINFCITEKK